MKTRQFLYDGAWGFSDVPAENADLVLAFGQRERLMDGGYTELRSAFPNSTVIAGSTAGEISNDVVQDGKIVATAIWFDKVKAISQSVSVREHRNSKEAGVTLAKKFQREGLRFICPLRRPRSKRIRAGRGSE